MSIDIAEAVKAIRDMAPIIDPDEDYLAIVAAEEGFAKSEAKRKKDLDQLHANFKGMISTCLVLKICMHFLSAVQNFGRSTGLFNTTIYSSFARSSYGHSQST